MPHISLLPHAGTPDELYALLQDQQVQAEASIERRMIACVALLVVGMLVPGPIGQAGFCLAAMVGIATAWAIADHVARNSLMHLMTLHELMRPRYESAETIFADWMREADGQEASQD